MANKCISSESEIITLNKAVQELKLSKAEGRSEEPGKNAQQPKRGESGLCASGEDNDVGNSEISTLSQVSSKAMNRNVNQQCAPEQWGLCSFQFK